MPTKIKQVVGNIPLPLTIRPWGVYYICLLVLAMMIGIPYLLQYMNGTAFKKVPVEFISACMGIVALMVIPILLIKFNYSIKLLPDRIRYTPLFKKSVEILYADIKKIAVNIVMVKRGHVDTPASFLNITTGTYNKNLNIDISSLSKDTQGLLVMVLSINAPAAELNEFADRINTGDLRKYNQAINKLALAGIIILIVVIIIKALVLFFKYKIVHP